MIKTFVVSLIRSEDRRKVLFEQLHNLDIDENLEWFKAIDGKNDDLSKYDIDRTKFQRFWHNKISCCSSNMYFSDSEYACSLSHLHIYQKIVDENIPMALVLEDDAIFKEEYLDVYKNLDKIVDKFDCEVLYLYSSERFKTKFKEQDTDYGVKVRRIGMGDLDWLFNRRRNVNYTVAYIITNEACKKLLKLAYPVRAQADVFLGMLAYNKLRSYKFIPNICEHGETNTTILHAGDMAINEKPWYSKLFKKFKSLYHTDHK